MVPGPLLKVRVARVTDRLLSTLFVYLLSRVKVRVDPSFGYLGRLLFWLA